MRYKPVDEDFTFTARKLGMANSCSWRDGDGHLHLEEMGMATFTLEEMGVSAYTSEEIVPLPAETGIATSTSEEMGMAMDTLEQMGMSAPTLG